MIYISYFYWVKQMIDNFIQMILNKLKELENSGSFIDYNYIKRLVDN